MMKMNSCERPEKYMLPTPVHLSIREPGLDFLKAKKRATEQARAYSSDAMLLSWYDRRSGRYSPYDVECCSEGHPSWVTYAKSRGGDLSVDINDEDYVFIFRGDVH